MRTPILVYHQIVSDGSPPDPTGFAIPMSHFRRDMAYLAAHGYRAVSLADLVAQERAGLAGSQEKTVCLTFDDGYEDFYLRVFPVLHAYHFTATVFLVASTIGGTSNWAGECGNRMMDWAQIGKLAAAGISFGSHSLTHPRLSRLEPAQAFDELACSLDILNGGLPQPCLAIAYPYGDSNREVQDLAAKAGYALGFGLERGRLSRLHLRRSLCRAGDSLLRLTIKLSHASQLATDFREDSVFANRLRLIKRSVLQERCRGQ